MKTKIVIAILGLWLIGGGGCASNSSSYRYTEAEPFVPTRKWEASLDQLAASKHRGDRNVVIALTNVTTRGLPAEAPGLGPLLVRAFAPLETSGILCLSPDFFMLDRNPVFLSAGLSDWILNTNTPLVDATSNEPATMGPDEAKIVRQLILFLKKHHNTDGTLPQFLRLQAHAYVDRDINNKREGVDGRLLAELGQGHAEAEASVERERNISRLNVSLALLDADGRVLPITADISADIRRTKDGSRFGLYILGSGAGVYRHESVTNGLGESLQAVVSYAVQDLCARLLALDDARPVIRRPATDLSAAQTPSPPSPPKRQYEYARRRYTQRAPSTSTSSTPSTYSPAPRNRRATNSTKVTLGEGERYLLPNGAYLELLDDKTDGGAKIRLISDTGSDTLRVRLNQSVASVNGPSRGEWTITLVANNLDNDAAAFLIQ